MPYTAGIDSLEPAFPDRPIPYIAYGSRFPALTTSHLVQTLGADRAFIIASTSLSRNTPALTRLQKAVTDTKTTTLVGTHIGIAPHTPWSEVVAITNEARAAFGGTVTERDVLITLGGGSITDGAKVIAWALSNPSATTDADLEAYYSGAAEYNASKLPPPVMRVISIPTTLSGGEYQSIAGVTRSDGTGQKCLFDPPRRNPSLVLLDPDLSTTTPERVWLSTGVRAIDHCVETLCSLRSNSVGDDAAEKGLRRLVVNLLRTKKETEPCGHEHGHGHGHVNGDGGEGHGHSYGPDLDARFESMLGVIDAMSAVGSGVPLGGSHAIGHQLGPLGVGHGETSCINLPAVCKWNAKYNANNERQAACRDILIETKEVRELVLKSGKKLEEVDLGDVLDLVIRALGMPRTLKEVGVGRDKLEMLAKNTLTDPWAPTNAKPITTKEDVLEILEMVVE